MLDAVNPDAPNVKVVFGGPVTAVVMVEANDAAPLTNAAVEPALFAPLVLGLVNELPP
jgi:hypothetical protein